MSRDWSEIGLQISDCLVLVVCVHFLLWNTLPKLSGSKQRVSNPSLHGSGSGRGWAGCQVWDGAAVSPAGSAGGGSICFLLRCVVSGRPLMGRWMEGLSFFPTWQLPSSEGNSEKSQRQGEKEREGERERERERAKTNQSLFLVFWQKVDWCSDALATKVRTWHFNYFSALFSFSGSHR